MHLQYKRKSRSEPQSEYLICLKLDFFSPACFMEIRLRDDELGSVS